MSEPKNQDLGPLSMLVGDWAGEGGTDVSPLNSDRAVPTTSLFREEMSFGDIGRVDNHDQIQFGLLYSTMAWRLEADEPFHQDTGYWLWDAKAGQVTRCFVVPRGIALIAGGSASADATRFEVRSSAGSSSYGICSNPYLAREFEMVSFSQTLTLHGPDSFSYEQDTVMRLPGRDELFHHTDKNTLTRVKG